VSIFSAGQDVTDFRGDYLAPALSLWAPKVVPSDGFLLRELRAAETETAQLLRVKLEPTLVFSHAPTTDELTAFQTNPAMPVLVEPGYDYDPGFFQGDRWGYIILRQHPVITLFSVKFAYPKITDTFYQIPPDWFRLDNKYGQLRLVPASAQFNAPLNAFIMSAFGGGSVIPSMLQVTYICGYTDVRTEMPNLFDVICRKAVLRLLEGFYLPASASISGDGLSQSQSFDAQDHRALINETLYGPKGANGGLWTAIHGIGMSVLGVVA
jgi:hypothetical protein